MKNQYFGDVNDYRKYGLLRLLASTAKLRLGVCWMLTADDHRPDGEFRRYLQDPGRWRPYDSELYDGLRRLLAPGTERSVIHARTWDLVPGASYFEALLADQQLARQRYFSVASQVLADSELVFFDPDNGIEVGSTAIGARDSCKYVYWRELIDMHGMGKSLLVYQHYPRVSRERFVSFLASRLAEELGAHSVTAFRTPHVVFFLVTQDRHREALLPVHETVAAQWQRQIEPWP